MAIETQFTIRNINVEQALKEAEAKVDQSAKKMDKALNLNPDGTKQAGEALEKAGQGLESVSKMGGKAGGVMKNVTESIKGMLSPIGLATAAVGLLASAIVSMWEKAKAKAEQVRKTYEWEATQAKAQAKDTDEGGQTGYSYLESLSAINQMEVIDNATKLEAVKIIGKLTEQYGDLGLSVDETTGKINGLSHAMEMQMQIATQSAMREAETSAEKSLTALQGRIDEVQDFGREDKISQRELVNAYAPRTEREEEIASMWKAIAFSPSSIVVTDTTEKIIEDYKKMESDRLQRAIQMYIKANAYYPNIEGLSPSEVMLMTGDIPMSEKEQALFDEGRKYNHVMIDTELDYETRHRAERLFSVTEDMRQAQARMDTAKKMAGNSQLDEESQEKWQKIYEMARDYYDILAKIKDMETFNGGLETPASKEVKASSARLAQAQSEREKSEETVVAKRTGIAQMNETRDERLERLENENASVLQQIDAEEEAVVALRMAYTDLAEEAENAKSKAKDGVFASSGEEQAYLAAETKRLDALTEIEKREASINNLKARQLDYEKEITTERDRQSEEEAKKQRDDITSRMKATMKGLFSNVLGDMKERTDSLALRGGYLGNTTSINPAQVNRQILNTVMTANNYLASIKQALANVGRI